MKYKSAYPFFPEEDIEEILKKTRSILEGDGLLSMGNYVSEFESSFASYIGVKSSVATNSCSSALEISLNSIEINPGDEVIIPAQTFIATGSSVVKAGGIPIFCEIDQNFLIDIKDLKNKITSKTKAVIIVHFAGLIHEDIEELKIFLNKKNIFLIEDAAHAAGSLLNGKKAGSFGNVACFSFFSTKNMTTGEGGIIVSNEDKILKNASSIRNRGQDPESDNEQFSKIGSNYRMTEFQALLGIYQLKRLDDFNRHRNKIASIYDKNFNSLFNSKVLSKQTKKEGNFSSFWKYWIILEDESFNPDDRSTLKEMMAEDSISVDWAYSPLVHLQPVFRSMYNISEGHLPASERIASRHLCLPIHSLISEEDADFISKTLLKKIKQLKQLKA